MSSLITIDPALGTVVTDTWDPPKPVETGRPYVYPSGGNTGSVASVNYVTIAVTATDGTSGSAVVLNQTAAENDIDNMSYINGSGYQVQITKIRVYVDTSTNPLGVNVKIAYPSKGDLTVVNSGSGFSVGETITFADGTPYGTVASIGPVLEP